MLQLKSNAPTFTVEPYILTGYRPQMSAWNCVRSMFSWHNQTMNIWTSILLVAFNIWLVHWTTRDTAMSPTTLVFFWAQGLLRAYCWVNSWAYHTFSCHSRDTAKYWCSADYIGCYLTPLGMGSNLMYIEFSCRPLYQSAFIVLGLGAIVVAIVLSMVSCYQTEAWRKVRLLVSGMSCLPYLVGIVVAIVVVHEATVPTYYVYLLYAAIVELFAGFFYVSMFPELMFPEMFDLYLPSHSIWHWLNFGFDALMMTLTYRAFVALADGGMCG